MFSSHERPLHTAAVRQVMRVGKLLQRSEW